MVFTRGQSSFFSWIAALTVALVGVSFVDRPAHGEMRESDRLLLDSEISTGQEKRINRDQQAGLLSGRYQTAQPLAEEPLREDPIGSGDIKIVEPILKAPPVKRRSQSRAPSSVSSSGDSSDRSPLPPVSQGQSQNLQQNPPQWPDLFVRFESEVNLSVGHLNEVSQSGLSLREYQMNAPQFEGQLRIWHPRGIGFGLRYGSTFGGAVSKSSGASAVASSAAERTESGVSLMYRLWKAQTTSMLIGAEMFETRFSVASNFGRLLSTETAGAILFAEVLWPSQWLFGVHVAPWLNHSEFSGATTVRSGAAVTDSAIAGASIRKIFSLADRREISLGFKYQMERNVFGGQSIGVDPLTLLPVETVVSTRTSTLIQFGYHWGAD